MVFVAQCVSGGGGLESHCGGDITRVNFFDLLSLVGVHLEKTADSLSFPLGRIVNASPGVQRPGINSEEVQRSNKRKDHNFKRKIRKWRLNIHSLLPPDVRNWYTP